MVTANVDTLVPSQRVWIEQCQNEMWSQKLNPTDPNLDLVFRCRDGSVLGHLLLLKMTSPVIGIAMDQMTTWKDSHLQVLVMDYDSKIVSKSLEIIYTGQAEFSAQEELHEVYKFMHGQLGISMNLEWEGRKSNSNDGRKMQKSKLDMKQEDFQQSFAMVDAEVTFNFDFHAMAPHMDPIERVKRRLNFDQVEKLSKKLKIEGGKFKEEQLINSCNAAARTVVSSVKHAPEEPVEELLHDVIKNQVGSHDGSIQRPTSSAADDSGFNGSTLSVASTADQGSVRRTRQRSSKASFAIIQVTKKSDEQVEPKRQPKRQPVKKEFSMVLCPAENRVQPSTSSSTTSKHRPGGKKTLPVKQASPTPSVLPANPALSATPSVPDTPGLLTSSISTLDYHGMVLNAVIQLDNPFGSSRQSICDYIIYSRDGIADTSGQKTKAKTRIRQMLRKMLKNDELIITDEKSRNPIFKLNPRFNVNQG